LTARQLITLSLVLTPLRAGRWLRRLVRRHPAQAEVLRHGQPARVVQYSVAASHTFWGTQWWKNNSGSGAAPAAFKGFAGQPAGLTGCTTPPATAPAFMAVLVTNPALVTQTGSTLTGPVKGVVIVQTSAGYGPDPGRTGMGMVIAKVCGN
jgi:hypothetical protein